MINEFTKNWLQELRSNKYIQVFNKMKDDEKGSNYFCALGVAACKVSKTYSPQILISENKEYIENIPHELIWRVMSWNDYEKLTFSEIADKIEEYYAANI